MLVEKIYETAKDTNERITEISPADRVSDAAGWIPTTLTLNPSKAYQKFEGFGGALPESSGYVLSRLPEAVRKAGLEQRKVLFEMEQVKLLVLHIGQLLLVLQGIQRRISKQ